MFARRLAFNRVYKYVHTMPFEILQDTYLLRTQVSLLQASADCSRTFSAARFSVLYRRRANSHSSMPPSAMAVQYTVDFIPGSMLKHTLLFVIDLMSCDWTLLELCYSKQNKTWFPYITTSV